MYCLWINQDKYETLLRSYELLIKVSPNVYNEYHSQENSPPRESTDTARNGSLVKEESNGDRSNNLTEPIYQVIQGTRADVKQGIVVFVKFCRTQIKLNSGIEKKKRADAMCRTNWKPRTLGKGE